MAEPKLPAPPGSAYTIRKLTADGQPEAIVGWAMDEASAVSIAGAVFQARQGAMFATYFQIGVFDDRGAMAACLGLDEGAME